MLNVTTKSENETFYYTNFVSLPKLESSRKAGDIIGLKQGNQNPQNNFASFSAASTAHVTEWSNYLTQWADSTIKVNASMGEEYCE